MKPISPYSQPSLRVRLSWKLAYALRPVYFALRRNRKKWRTTLEQMRQMPEGSLGKDVAVFLDGHKLTLMPGVEWHDVYHVLFGYDTTMRGEGCIQFVPMGNGRWSVPYITCNLFFYICYPEYRADFRAAFRRGKAANKFHHLDLEPLLLQPTAAVQAMIFGAPRLRQDC